MPAEDDCQVWTAEVDTCASDALLDMLSGSERERLRAYRRPEPARTFLVSAALLRVAWSSVTGVPPDRLRVVRRCPVCDGPHGRPTLGGPLSAYRASVTHSGGRVLVAVARHDVGLDCERVRDDLDVDGLLEVLSPPEAAALRRAPGAVRSRLFLACWVRREAVVKLLGTGLTDDVELVLTPPYEPPEVLSLGRRGGAYQPGSPSLYDFTPFPHHVGCLASARPVRHIRLVEGRAALSRWRTRHPEGARG